MTKGKVWSKLKGYV